MQNQVDSISFVRDILTIIALLCGGVWTLLRFSINRERFAKIEFNLDLIFLIDINGEQIIELASIIANKGQVRQKIRSYTFDLLYISDDDEIDISQTSINNQVMFNKIISKRNWIPWNYTFIDGGTTQRYTYLTIIPKNAKLLLLRSQFVYPGSKDFHKVQKAFVVPLNNLQPDNN
jgi:hypothetical protein